MKKFNLKIFKVAMVVVILLTFISWVGLEANVKERQFHAFWSLAGSMWAILRFPIFALYWHFLYNYNNLIFFSIAVFLNCAFYGFLFERFYSLRTGRSKFPNTPTRG
jgi:hypothetical protein